MSTLRPIEIIGGGLAGLSLGLALRRQQVPVTIFEAGSYPRHRVCGEFIAGLSASTIQKLGLAPFLNEALSQREVAWFNREELIQQQTLPSPAYGLSRHRLDAALAEAFVANGGILNTNSRIARNPTSPGQVLATGRRRTRSPWIGLKIHTRNLRTTTELELHLGTECYVGLSHIENEEVNVCGLFRRQSTDARGADLICAYLRQAGLIQLADRLGDAQLDEDSFCAVAAVCFDRKITTTEGIALGDHAAMIPPFTGNGMAMAFQSAEVALDPLLDYANHNVSWIETCSVVQKKLRQTFNRRLASANLLHPFLLKPHRQKWLANLSRYGLLPMRPLYSILH